MIAIETPYKKISYQKLYETITSDNHPKLRDLKNKNIAFTVELNEKHIVLLLKLLYQGNRVCLLSKTLSSNQRQTFKQAFPSFLDLTDPPNLIDLQSTKFSKTSNLSHLANLCLFTSGTTGPPKLVESSFQAIVESAKLTSKALKINSQSRYLLTLPIDKTGGLAAIFRTLYSKGTIILDKDRRHWLSNIELFKPTHLSLVKPQVQALIETKIEHSLDAILLGGSHFEPSLLKKGLKKKLPLHIGYGMTETNSMILHKALRNDKELSCSGKPLDHVTISIDENNNIFITSPTLFSRYLYSDKTCAIAQKPFPTKDLGIFQQDGTLEILGRSDNIFISGGYNVSPEKISKALLNLPHIDKVFVTDVFHEKFSRVGIAFIQSKQKLKIDDLKKYLETYLEFYEIPKHFVFCDFEERNKSVSSSEKKRLLNRFQKF